MSPAVFLERYKNERTDKKSTSSRHLLTGRDVLLDGRTDKGTAFTIEERQVLRIHGLLPPSIATLELQVERFMENLRHMPDDLSRYISLLALQDRNETLFYRVVMQHTQETMPLIYTPTVGLAFTDGERILGLGDLGCHGMGIPVGKLSLYTALAGVPPQYCLPMMLDVGTNNETLLNDKYYLGLRRKRITGKEYDDFIDEFMQAVTQRFGRQCLIQFEDFANHNAFRFLAKYRDGYCTFNDDIQGTASVAIAGILSSIRITQRKLADNIFVFYGAGEASIGISDLLMLAMEREGVSAEEARKKIFLVDSKGLIVKNRPTGGLNKEKMRYAHEREPITKLTDIIDAIKPTFLIGAAGQGPSFTREILEKMASFNKHPVIFALSNPTSKAECTAQEAYEATNGQCIFISGSPFPNVEYQGKTYVPGQGNNCYIFPGVALAVVTCLIRHVPEEIFYIAAKTLSDLVTQEDLAVGLMYPSIEKIHDVSRSIAVNVAEYAYANNLAALYPKPNDLDEFIKLHQYIAEYKETLPRTWNWPKVHEFEQ
ncbi:unnamed protein product [Rotaria sp. Silwood2]|nr:unnamed protein product [Rotaria sp. Silwood2]